MALLLAGSVSTAAADEAPTKWEQLFFPFPIVAAPPQLEQQIQIFNDYFRGSQGSADVLSAELAYIATPHFGLVLDVPFQIGIGEQPTGFGDLELLGQWIVAGSLRLDNMLSAGVTLTFPTGQHGLGSGDYFAGGFVFAAQRFWHRLIFEVNATAMLPVVHGDSARQIATAALVSVLVTPLRFEYPLYLQVEANSNTYLGGTAALPPDATSSPAQTVFLAPEIFIGPFRTPISDGTRVAAGVFFNLVGDSVHDPTYSFTFSFDIPNRYGY